MCCSALRFETFCCCCTLRTGAIIVAVFRLVPSMASIICVPAVRASDTYATGTIVGRVFGCLLSLLIQGLLVYGIYKKRKCFAVPWLILVFVENLLYLVYVIVMFISILTDSDQSDLHFSVTLLCILLIYEALCWYCWLCVWSYYKQLCDLGEQETSEIHSTPRNTRPEHNKNGNSPA